MLDDPIDKSCQRCHTIPLTVSSQPRTRQHNVRSLSGVHEGQRWRKKMESTDKGKKGGVRFLDLSYYHIPAPVNN